MAFDRHMNVVLGDSEEYRKLPPKKGREEVKTRTLKATDVVSVRGKKDAF